MITFEPLTKEQYDFLVHLVNSDTVNIPLPAAKLAASVQELVDNAAEVSEPQTEEINRKQKRQKNG